MPKYVQMWLPGFEPRTEQPDLPGFGANDEIEPSARTHGGKEAGDGHL